MFRMYARDLDPAETEAISRIKGWVNRCVETRDALASSSTAAPSDYWQYSAQLASYMRGMPPELFSSLRLHTDHIDGDTYANTIGSHAESYAQYYAFLRRGLPERYWISAPQLCGEYGHSIDGWLVNDKVLKWQGIIRDLWYNEELPRLEKIERPVILEIGAGYGGMAHHFMTLFPEARYVIVDLPETLLFSASYLTMIHGENRVVLLDQDSQIAPDSPDGGLFLMVPNFLLPSLSSLHFDLAMNMDSFQEMTESQVTEYLKFLAPRTKVLYSKNIDEFEFSSDKVSVTPLLRKFYDLRALTPGPPHRTGNNPAKRMLRAYAGKARRAIVAALYWSDRKSAPKTKGGSYLATPKIAGGAETPAEDVAVRSA